MINSEILELYNYFNLPTLQEFTEDMVDDVEDSLWGITYELRQEVESGNEGRIPRLVREFVKYKGFCSYEDYYWACCPYAVYE